MNGKALIPLVAGLAIGGVALWMGVNTLRAIKGSQKPVESVPVWAAKEGIPRGTEITAEMIQTIPFPQSLVPKGAILKQEELVGRVPRVDAPGGLPVLDEMLLPPGARPGIHVKAGYRAVAVKIDEGSGVDYHLQPGAFVDVVGSFATRRGNRQETLARTLVENVEIAAVGPRISANDGKEEGDKPQARNVRAITLFVKPEDVPRLLLAEQNGKIKLSLRGDATDNDSTRDARPVSNLELTGQIDPDDEKSDQPSVLDRLQKLFQRQPAPASQPVVVVAAPPPAPLPDESWSVVVYRGDTEIKSIRFRNRESSERIDESREAPAGGDGNATGTPAAEAPPTEPPAPVEDVPAEPSDEESDASKESQE